jgi:hypothetical protein
MAVGYFLAAVMEAGVVAAAAAEATAIRQYRIRAILIVILPLRLHWAVDKQH